MTDHTGTKSTKTKQHPPDQPGTLSRHAPGFLISGILAFATDAGILLALTNGAGLDPFFARLVAIACAMIVGWLAHRRWTFRVLTPLSFGEFGKYASLAWGVSALNYGIYAGLLIALPTIPVLLAMTISSAIAMAVSYVGMRFGVFATKT